MGFLDRLLKGNSSDTPAKPKVPVDKKAAFFLDSDSSSSLGDVAYMREAKTIMHTFPGTASSPGDKKLVFEVDAMDTKLEERSQGLGGSATQEQEKLYPISSGIPKPVKKTFAEKMTQEEMEKRLRGSAITGVNTNAPIGAKAVSGIQDAQYNDNNKPKNTKPKANIGRSSSSGSIDPFRAMARDLNN